MPTILFEYMGVKFEWDDDKYAKVMNAHTIAFEECASVFLDPNYVTIDDTRFTYDEERFLTIGMSNQGRLLVVAWTFRGDNIRLITAVKAEKSYEKRYNRGC